MRCCLAVWSSKASWHFYEEPVVESLHPWVGGTMGGTVVQVYGSGFLSSTHSFCKFGHLVVMAVRKSDSMLLCASPAMSAAGAVAVEVTMNDQQYSNSSIAFEYQSMPMVRSLTPSKGPSQGGSYVVVLGSGFSQRSSTLEYLYCRFNLTRVAATFVSESEVHCYAPDGAPGYVDVEVTNNELDYTRSGVQYECQCMLVTAVEPVVVAVPCLL